MLLIVAFVLLVVLPSPWRYLAFVVGLALFVVEVLGWNRTVRGKRKRVGPETLIGRTARVVSACDPTGQVRVGGEIWAARCDAGAEEGETVTVVGRDGLTLAVQRAADEPAALGA
jgi:membrane protein implicated in regulation of membrane protease activity